MVGGCRSSRKTLPFKGRMFWPLGNCRSQGQLGRVTARPQDLSPWGPRPTVDTVSRHHSARWGLESVY